MVETENNRGSECRRALLFYYGVVLLWLEVWHIRAEDTERRLCVPGPFREPYKANEAKDREEKERIDKVNAADSNIFATEKQLKE